jgi:hypothetical protein
MSSNQSSVDSRQDKNIYWRLTTDFCILELLCFSSLALVWK